MEVKRVPEVIFGIEGWKGGQDWLNQSRLSGTQGKVVCPCLSRLAELFWGRGGFQIPRAKHERLHITARAGAIKIDLRRRGTMRTVWA